MNAALPAELEPVAAPVRTAAAWTYDPWRERPRVAALALAGALGLCALVVSAREPFLVAAGLCAFCIAAFAPALAPTEVRLDGDAVAARSLFGWQRRRWASVRRVDVLPAAVLLSPFAERRWLDRTRGLVLPLPAEGRAERIALIRSLQEAAIGRP